nr:MAG TPA: hypothetical protein [Caudoviricetes sp.]
MRSWSASGSDETKAPTDPVTGRWGLRRVG